MGLLLALVISAALRRKVVWAYYWLHGELNLQGILGKAACLGLGPADAVADPGRPCLPVLTPAC